MQRDTRRPGRVERLEEPEREVVARAHDCGERARRCASAMFNSNQPASPTQRSTPRARGSESDAPSGLRNTVPSSPSTAPSYAHSLAQSSSALHLSPPSFHPLATCPKCSSQRCSPAAPSPTAATPGNRALSGGGRSWTLVTNVHASLGVQGARAWWACGWAGSGGEGARRCGGEESGGRERAVSGDEGGGAGGKVRLRCDERRATPCHCERASEASARAGSRKEGERAREREGRTM